MLPAGRAMTETFYKVPVLAAESNPAALHIPTRPASKMLTATLVTAIRRELDNCLNNHETCLRRALPALPRRVLDLGPGASHWLASFIRLYEPASNTRAEYAALSYCWGEEGQNLTTTRANHSSHLLHGIPKHDIPKTISDAIEVCRSLKIRYLWVDALCIVQDDADDKGHEIGKMVDIYRNSTVSIVAASAGRVSDGFLDYDEVQLTNPPQLPFCLDPHASLQCDHPAVLFDEKPRRAASSGTVYLRRLENHENEYTLQKEPLFHRAWAFQEYLLSPRALIFDSRQVLYKCRFFHPSLKTILDTGLKVRNPISWKLPAGVFGVESSSPSSSRPQKLRWKQIIEEYSKRRLTYFDDRLSALAGVAAALGKASSDDDTYVAGMWTKSLLTQLCWEASLSRGPITTSLGSKDNHNKQFKLSLLLNPRTPPPPPSWSWASCRYPVTVIEVSQLDAKLIRADVELASSDSPYGPVSKASITLEARVVDASVVINAPERDHHKKDGRFSRLFDLDDEDYKDQSSPINWDACRMIFVGTSIVGRNFMFIVVEQLPEGGGTFRRVGRFTTMRNRPERIRALDWRGILSNAKREVVVIE
ncbi:heterokaryon incompatibility protein-domain-containing protein [Cladorrhinum sp. PSN332]|nr:heterokaryon incompatibility protein-domain-containing protein [Cladorrhinum sp. PSN332]